MERKGDVESYTYGNIKIERDEDTRGVRDIIDAYIETKVDTLMHRQLLNSKINIANIGMFVSLFIATQG